MQEIVRVGKCIYCGTTHGKLSDEHAIPYGLSGNLVLHDASCGRCAGITSKIEMACLRGLLAKARARLRLRTRRPKSVLTNIRFDHGFGWNSTTADAKEYAGMNPLPVYGPPSILSGQRIDGALNVRGLDTLNLGNPLPSVGEKVQGHRLSYEFQVDMDVWAFARMIAKIGFCCAVADLGLARISEVFVLPSILGDRNDVQTWVGSEDIPAVQSHNLHEVTIIVRDQTVLAYVWLFAAFGGRPYTVIVGTFRA